CEIILRKHVGNVERAMLAHPLILWLIDTNLEPAHEYGTKMGPRNHNVALVKSQQYVIDPTNLCRALDDGIEDRLHVCRRGTDAAEHLTRCRLVLQGLAQFAISFLDLFEQPDVLDRDYCLRRESLE